MSQFAKDRQYYKFCAYGFLKNLRLYDAFLLLFLLENGLSYTQIGLLYASREISTNALEIPSGLIADSFGRKNTLLGAFGLYMLAAAVLYFSTHMGLLFLCMIFLGIGDAFRSGTHKGMIMDYLRQNGWSAHKVSYYGNTRGWSQRGSALSALIAGLLVFYGGEYRIIILLSLIPYVINFFNLATYPESINFATKRSEDKRGSSLRETLSHFWQSLRRRQVLQVINSSAMHSAYLKAIKDYIQMVMLQISLLLPFWLEIEDKRKSGLVIGLLYTIIYLFTSQASRSAKRLTKGSLALPAQRTLILGIACGLFSGLMIYYEWWLAAWGLFAVVFVIESLRKPILTSMLADQVQSDVLTSVLSAQSFYGTILVSGLALIFGLIADYGSIGIALMTVSGLLLGLAWWMGAPHAKTSQQSKT
ncbi:MAG: MFS transporter [Bacteroidota bacterium]